jgi:5-methylcytosine-specific restriction protein A
MPWKPKHPCRYAGCSALAEHGESYCSEHKSKVRIQYEAQRGTSTERGYNARWRRLRQWFLNSHPLCAECGRHGILKAAAVVDHVIPHRGDQTLLYDQSNLQSLCTTCHNRKTATEDGGLGNRQSSDDQHRALTKEAQYG